jgi:DNA polymerase III delta subunit
MLTVLLGEDTFAKDKYLQDLLVKSGQEAAKYKEGDELPRLTSLGGNDLFGVSKTHIFYNNLKAYELPELEAASQSSAQIVFIETSLDKRLTKTKKILELAASKDFPAPDINAASKWIIDHAKSLDIKIQANAANQLATRLMGETSMTLSVLAAHNELLKLASYSAGAEITAEMVNELTPQDINIDIFKLLDSIANHRKAEAVGLLQRYYESTSEDEKILTIRLIALLSDQLRNLLLTKQLFAQNIPDQAILQQTGWKSGRLFIMKKLSAGFKESQLQSALTKFYSLDKELKSTTLPTRVIVDMIIAAL